MVSFVQEDRLVLRPNICTKFPISILNPVPHCYSNLWTFFTSLSIHTSFRDDRLPQDKGNQRIETRKKEVSRRQPQTGTSSLLGPTPSEGVEGPGRREEKPVGGSHTSSRSVLSEVSSVHARLSWTRWGSWTSFRRRRLSLPQLSLSTENLDYSRQ